MSEATKVDIRALALDLMWQSAAKAVEDESSILGASKDEWARHEAVEWALISIAESLARIATMQ